MDMFVIEFVLLEFIEVLLVNVLVEVFNLLSFNWDDVDKDKLVFFLYQRCEIRKLLGKVKKIKNGGYFCDLV